MTDLTLAKAAIIVDKALEYGRTLKLKPLTVAVLDAGGHLVALKREDGSSILRPQIAEGKAWGVLGMGFGGREFARRAQTAPVFLTALMAASGGRIVPVPGGVLIRSGDAAVLGAVGISGDTSEQDEACAVYGIKAAALVPDTGDPAK
ncbi:MAG TPA: heme-binding protein [Stellaceae bacterium]|nr:heme-binding protein [Stellaceae bacterium]